MYTAISKTQWRLCHALGCILASGEGTDPLIYHAIPPGKHSIGIAFIFKQDSDSRDNGNGIYSICMNACTYFIHISIYIYTHTYMYMRNGLRLLLSTVLYSLTTALLNNSKLISDTLVIISWY